MRNAVIDLLLVRIHLRKSLANTLREDLGITLGVASVFAVRTLHARRVFEKLPTERTPHDVVELLFDEFVALFLNDVLFLLAHGTLAVQTKIHGTAPSRLFLEVHRQMNASCWL